MNVYIDSECKCHVSNPDGTLREFDIPLFDGKCDAFVEGYRYCPEGESYTRDDGKVFYGECITAWTDYSELEAAQREYEQQMLEEYETLINDLYAEVTS